MTERAGATVLTLRGHHLLCVLNYSGNGYTPAFIANLNQICDRLNAGEAVRLTWRADSVCQPMLQHQSCHCYQASIVWRDFWGFLATSMVLRRWCFPPRSMVLRAEQVARLRGAFRSGAIRTGCLGCEWFGVCSSTAQAGWVKSKLRLRA
jgi:hypothetical protein